MMFTTVFEINLKIRWIDGDRKRTDVKIKIKLIKQSINY